MMNTYKFSKPWLPLERVESLIGLEPFLIIIGMGLFSYVAYRVFLKKAPPHRHRNLRRAFLNLSGHSALLALMLGVYLAARIEWEPQSFGRERILPYYGLLMILYGIRIFLKVFRIYVFEYLFLVHPTEGVPRLLVNISSLLLSIVLYGWVLTEVLAIQVIPVLATSAVFTAIIGLALQDTLGNLFSGVALQFDKPFEIGDWIEVEYHGQRRVGLVDEVSWRATVLISFTDELICIPNKVIALSQISNFTRTGLPIVRAQTFKIPFESDIEQVTYIISNTVAEIPGIEKTPAPKAFALENTSDGLAIRVIYRFKKFNDQFSIGDQVLKNCHRALREAGVEMGRLRIENKDLSRAA